MTYQFEVGKTYRTRGRGFARITMRYVSGGYRLWFGPGELRIVGPDGRDQRDDPTYDLIPPDDTPAATEGRKDDTNKNPWHLLPFDALRAITKVLAFGATKYGGRNWEAGMDWDRPFAACLRHLTAWHEGEKADPETGFSHLWHAGCCILFLISYELRSVGRDTRPPRRNSE